MPQPVLLVEVVAAGRLSGGQHPLPKLGAHVELPPALPAWGTATSQLGSTGAAWCASSMPTTPSSPPVLWCRGKAQRVPPEHGVAPGWIHMLLFVCVCVMYVCVCRIS